jgi:predicted alpha/beta superfamily hydrolase
MLIFATVGGACSPTVENSAGLASGSEDDTAVVLGHRRVLRSKLLGEDRELSVYLPNGYESSESKRYPLVVLLDGRMVFSSMAAMIHTLSEGGAIPRAIVVGISNTNRWRDLTPVEGMGIPGTGGGEPFLASLSGEILPYIDSHWRTNGFRVFSGHSLGGLTTLNALQESPELFDAYLALSPSLEWGDGFMTERYRAFLSAAMEQEKLLYLAIADEAMERPYYDEMVQLLRDGAPTQLAWTSEIFEEYDDHMSIRVTGGLAGIRWVFRDWRLTSNRIYGMTGEQIEEHYRRATQRYKEPRALTMWEITDAGYWGLYDSDMVEKAMGFLRLAVEKWPDHPYPYSCLGEGLERTGRPEEALEQMQRALQMAKDTGVQDLPYYQGMVDRVTDALGR